MGWDVISQYYINVDCRGWCLAYHIGTCSIPFNNGRSNILIIDIKCGVRLVSSLSHRHNIYIYDLSYIISSYSNGRKEKSVRPLVYTRIYDKIDFDNMDDGEDDGEDETARTRRSSRVKVSKMYNII